MLVGREGLGWGFYDWTWVGPRCRGLKEQSLVNPAQLSCVLRGAPEQPARAAMCQDLLALGLVVGGCVCRCGALRSACSPSPHKAPRNQGQSMQFVPLVGTTLGRLGAASDAVAMSWGLAHTAAEKAFLTKGLRLDTVSPPRVSTPHSSSSFAPASSTATPPASPLLCAELAALLA
eukprot:3045072-Rhodomonas_salina.1